MKQSAQLALHRTSRYVLLFEHELEVLDTLPLWMTRLFVALIRSSNYQTGHGRTTYAQLVDALRPLQPARGGRRHYAPDEKAILRAIAGFQRRHIVARDTGWNQTAGGLFFELAPRRLKARPQASSVTGLRHPRDSLKNEQRRGL